MDLCRVLHFVFLPRINQDLVYFVKQWNHHGLRKDHHKSQLQLFVSKLSLANTRLTAIQGLGHEALGAQGVLGPPATTSTVSYFRIIQNSLQSQAVLLWNIVSKHINYNCTFYQFTQTSKTKLLDNDLEIHFRELCIMHKFFT